MIRKKINQVLFILAIIGLLAHMAFQSLPMDLSLKVLGFKQMIVISETQSNVLERGDFFIVRRIDPEEIESGDIISYYTKDVETQKRVIVTSTLPQTVPNEDIIGKLWFKIPKIGCIVLQFNHPIFIGLAISTLAFGGAAYLLIDEKRKTKSN